jgi:hypothetical protein
MAGSNSPFSSRSSIGSLITKSQNNYDAIQNKIQEYNDASLAYEWDNSAKTYEDFLAYSGYLDSQKNSTTDPMKQLSYTRKVDSARSGYISNTIQKASIDVIEGAGSNTDKYNKMTDLYYQAANSGQYDLAQSLRLQLDNLSVTIQNEQQAGATAGAAASSKANTENIKAIDNQLKDSIDTVKGNAAYLLQQYSQLGAKKFGESLKANGMQGDVFGVLASMLSNDDPNNPGLIQLYQQAAGATPDPAKANEYNKAIQGIVGHDENGTPVKESKIFDLPGVGGITFKDIQDQAYAAAIGETLFDTVQTGQGLEFKRNATTGFQYGRDENGAYKLMPIYANKADFTSQVAGKKGKNQSYTDLLKGQGFDVTGEGSNLTVRNNGEFNNAGVLPGQQVQLYVDASGNLQFLNGDKAYNVNFDSKTGKYVGLEEQTPNPITLLPSGNQQYSKFSNRYTNTLDLNTLNAGTIGVIDSTSPYARPVGPGTLLAQGAATQLQIQRQQELQRALAPAPKAVNVQPQSAVNVMSAPRNTSISIAKPKPLPTITLAKPKPLPNLTVNNAPNTQSVKVNNAPNTQTIRI